MIAHVLAALALGVGVVCWALVTARRDELCGERSPDACGACDHRCDDDLT